MLRRWEYFKEDTKTNRRSLCKVWAAGADLLPAPGALSGPHARLDGIISTASGSFFAIDARLTYAAAAETSCKTKPRRGIDRFGAAQNRQILVSGNGDWPGDDRRLQCHAASRAGSTSSTGTSVASNTRMAGNILYRAVRQCEASPSAAVNFQFLGVRLMTNAH